MGARHLADLPWPSICAAVRRLAAEEARCARLPAAAVEDVAQEACLRLLMVGRIPAGDLLGPAGGWLRRVVSNCAHQLARGERRWRLGNSRPAAEARLRLRAREPVSLDPPTNLAHLPRQERIPLTLLLMHVPLAQIALLEQCTADEARRRARWAGVRLAPHRALPQGAGRVAGGLELLRGARRRAAMGALAQFGWPPREVAAEFKASERSRRRSVGKSQIASNRRNTHAQSDFPDSGPLGTGKRPR
jgi:DNA-directed RNA polymerase specialized sigma24 family protein